jgi:TonB family protein
MKIFFAVSLSLFCAGAVAQTARPVSDKDVAARPVLIVAPTYPALAGGEATAAEIRVTGTVSRAGLLEQAQIAPAPGREKFVDAVKDVLAMWRFRPSISEAECTPVAQQQSFVVWFSQDQGKPRVAVSVAKDETAAIAPGKAGTSPGARAWHTRPSIEFPENARERGIEGAAEVALQVSPGGEILKSTLVYATPLSAFGDAAMRGMRGARLAPLTVAGGASACMVVPFGFCTESTPAVANSACTHS